MNIINKSPVMEALDSHISALDILRFMLSMQGRDHELSNSWILDEAMLKRAVSFHWAVKAMDAVIQASRSIPGDTELSHWNLSTEAVWWHFEKPLPWPTVTAVEPDGTTKGIRALSMGWFALPGTTMAPRFVISCWLDDPSGRFLVCPSQTWHWHMNEPLSAMIARINVEHDKLYGTGGRFAERAHVGTPVFITTATAIAHFVLAALAWLDQKVVHEDTSEVPLRQRRKEFARKANREPVVKVIQLRRAERVQPEPGANHKAIDWSCQWVVDGHWRHQPCGLKNAERRLRWINPFMKGPEDKPLKAKAVKAYEVSR